jgi:hypothetical protein
MKKRYFLFVAIAFLALSWTSWLAYQAYTVADPEVVSAPQLYLASFVVVAEVRPAQPGQVTAKIIKVYKDDLVPFRQLPLELKVIWPDTAPLPTQPTLFLLPLQGAGQASENVHKVVSIPTPQRLLEPQVYRFTDSVRLQTERILKK